MPEYVAGSSSPQLTIQVDRPSLAAANGYLILNDATYGKLDTAKVAPDAIFDDVTTYCQTFTIQRGMSSWSGLTFEADASTCDATFDNRTRSFDPNVAPDSRPGAQFKITCTYASTTYRLFAGFADAWDVSYPLNARHSTTIVKANDGVVRLADANVTEQLAADDTGGRIGTLANRANWPSNLRNIDTGMTRMPGSGQTSSAWAAMQEAALSETGDLYVDGAGTLVFKNRGRIVSDTRSITSTATYGDAGGTERKYQTLVTTPSDRSDITNRVILTYNDTNQAVTRSDPRSIGMYGLHDTQLQVKNVSATAVGEQADFLLSLYKSPSMRFTQVAVNPFRDPTNLWPLVLAAELGDRITVKLTPPGGGSRLTHTCFIRGIRHEVSPRQWLTTFTLQDAQYFPTTAFVLDTSQLDTGTLYW